MMNMTILAMDNETTLTGYAAIASAILAPVSQVLIAYLTKKNESKKESLKQDESTGANNDASSVGIPADPELSNTSVESGAPNNSNLRKTLALLPSLFYLVSLIGVVFYVNSLRKVLPTIEVNECPVGAIIIWGSNNAIPENWRVCDGSELAAGEYKELFTAVGTTWGGSKIAFLLPNFSARFLQGADTADAVTNRKAVKVGSYQNAMLPPHTHEKGNLRVAGGRSPNSDEFMFRMGSTEMVPNVNFHAYPHNDLPVSGTHPADCIEILGEPGVSKPIPQEILDEQVKPTNAAVVYIIKVH